MRTSIEFRLRAAFASLFLGLAAINSASAADLYVPTGYPDIQAAVDAAQSNDTIHIAAGVYAGQVLISNKSLTLLGSPGAVLRATDGMSQPYTALGFVWVPLLGILRSEVVVSGLTFEGERLADTQASRFAGIFFIASGGCVEGCRLTGFRGRDLGSGYGNALRVVNPVNAGANPVTVQILRSTFADNLISIALLGDGLKSNDSTYEPTLLRTTFVVSDNTIIGNGPDATGAQYGVHIFPGAAGEVSRNTISDHAFIGGDQYPFALGIAALDYFDLGNKALVPLKPIRFEGNQLRNNQWHMLVLRGDGSTILDNTFDGTAPGLRPTGLGLSGENLPVARNRFSNMPNGIILLGNDPDFGTSLGIAQNAQLNTNRFCNITDSITVEPLATHAEQGTLACTSPPALAIAPAVLLSWPGDEDGWTVESAAAVDGPWTPLIATPFLERGRYSVAVPTDVEHRFFRLR